jgi:hypothetical protein
VRERRNANGEKAGVRRNSIHFRAAGEGESGDFGSVRLSAARERRTLAGRCVECSGDSTGELVVTCVDRVVDDSDRD